MTRKATGTIPVLSSVRSGDTVVTVPALLSEIPAGTRVLISRRQRSMIRRAYAAGPDTAAQRITAGPMDLRLALSPVTITDLPDKARKAADGRTMSRTATYKFFEDKAKKAAEQKAATVTVTAKIAEA